MKKVSLGTVEKFIKGELQQLLREDLLHHRIFKEADLECCVYFHLRKRLEHDKRWRIFGRKHSRKTGHYTDLVLYKRYSPSIAIELKWRTTELGQKDRSALGKALMKLRVKKAYFFSSSGRSSNSTETKNASMSTWRIDAVASADRSSSGPCLARNRAKSGMSNSLRRGFTCYNRSAAMTRGIPARSLVTPTFVQRGPSRSGWTTGRLLWPSSRTRIPLVLRCAAACVISPA